MNKTYISSLLVVFLAGAQTIRAQENLDDVLAQLESADEAAEQAVIEAEAVPMSAEDALLDRGIKYFRAGELAKAEAVFEAVLAEDEYNRRAMDYLKRTAQKMAAKEKMLQEATREQALAEVDSTWNPDSKLIALPPDESAAPAVSDDELARIALTARLKTIMIPALDFRDANIRDVVVWLGETSRQKGPGVNILLLGMEDSMEADASNITISIRDMSLYEALQYIVEMAGMKFDVQAKAVAVMPVGYVPATELELVTYEVIPEVGAELESMADGGGGGGVDDLFGEASSSSSSGGPTDVVGFFTIVEWPDGSSAVYQPNFHKLFVKNTPKNLEAVENILAELEDKAIKQRSQQVEIVAKFVEYNEGALEELGFDWTMYDDGTFGGLGFESSGTYYQPGQGYTGAQTVNDTTPNTYVGDRQVPTGPTMYNNPVTGYYEIDDSRAGTGTGQSLFGQGKRNNSTAFETLQSGILSTMGGAPASMVLQNRSSFPFDLAITAMEQEGSADVLSAPKVTTKSGNEAVIRVVEVHRYPQDYDVETGQRTAPVVKPQDWEDYDLGVVLKVTPVVDAESNTIDLDLQPEITKFKGFDEYIAGYNAYESGSNNSTDIFGNSAPLLIKMPFFETRAIQTQVTIADGSTIVMGGLVDERTETFRDQVPFLGDIPYLGRLFRSEGSRSAKKNLVISVKATQVDDRGMTRDQRELQRQAAAN